MADIFRINQGPDAGAAMRCLADLAVINNGGEPIIPDPEGVAALADAQERLRLAGIHTGSSAVSGSVEAAI